MNRENRLWALERQIARLQRRLIDLERRSRRYSWLRLAVFFGGGALSAIFFFLGYLPFFGGALAATLITFELSTQLGPDTVQEPDHLVPPP